MKRIITVTLLVAGCSGEGFINFGGDKGPCATCEGEESTESMAGGDTVGGSIDGVVGPGVEGSFVDQTPECEGSTGARLWRLSHAQYDNTVRDLLGTAERLGAGFEPETSGTGFRNGADVGFVSATLAGQYMNAAQTHAETAVQNLDALLPCTPADPADEACVRNFIDQFGARAFRQPLTDRQKTLYLGVYSEGAKVAPEFGVQLVVEAMLQSPYFLYRFELGAPAGGATPSLTAYEMATLLSYLLWDTMPDEALYAKADDGTLFEPEVLQGEIDRMLRDPRAEGFFWGFFEQYLGLGQVPYLEKDGELYPEFDAAMGAKLVAEAEAFVNHVAWNGSGSLGELLTADYSFVDASLADWYGVDGVSGDELQRATLPPERAGLLTQAGFLALHADDEAPSPTFRGLFVRSKLLCQTIPDPPANVNDALPPLEDVTTNRERYEAHMSNESCVGCHKLMDPIGFGFEEFDAAGRYRTQDNGADVDASGEVLGTTAIDGTFRGARELAEKLAGAQQVSDCVATHFFRYMLGRLEQSADSCELDVIRGEFAESGTDLHTLVQLILNSDALRYRKTEVDP